MKSNSNTRKLKVGQVVYAVKYDKITLTVIKTRVTSVATIEKENKELEVEYYYRDEANYNSSDFSGYDIYTESEFKKFLNSYYFIKV